MRCRQPIRNVLRGTAQVARGAVRTGAMVIGGTAQTGAQVLRGGAGIVGGTAHAVAHPFQRDRCWFRHR